MRPARRDGLNEIQRSADMLAASLANVSFEQTPPFDVMQSVLASLDHLHNTQARSSTYVVFAHTSDTARTLLPARSSRCTVLMNDDFPGPKIHELRMMNAFRHALDTLAHPRALSGVLVDRFAASSTP
jgi:hypothetical protein